MVNYSDEQLNNIFSSLADPTRRNILLDVMQHELSVGQVAEPYAMSLPAVSKHLKVLERAHLIHKRKKGKEYIISANQIELEHIVEYMLLYRRFWNKNLDALQRFVES